VSLTNEGDAAPARLDERVRAALVARHDEPGAGAVQSSLTFGWRALLKVKHMPEQLFDVIVTPIMFTVIFTYLFGGALAGSPDAYLQFLLPGILVQTVVFTSVYTGFTLNTDIGKGVFDRFRSLPIWKPAPLVGAMLGDSVRYSISSLVVIVVGLIMGFRPPAGALGLLGSVLILDVFAFGIGWIFTVIALMVRSPSTVMTLSWLVLMPLTFASNIFVDPRTMPGWLQTFVAVNPVALLVHAVRGIMTGSVSAADLAYALIAPALITLVCAPTAMLLYERER
jgi:daunorubicin/doxorubicin transport system permease protein